MRSSYFNLPKKELEKRADEAWKLLSPCRVCPRRCGNDRALNEKIDFCRMGKNPKISSFNPHFGEERPLVGIRGSGTIFFSSCNLACVYCQNFGISQLRYGDEIEIETLAEMMIKLQKVGCPNINFVSPTTWVPQILKSLPIAIKKGLKIPLVYNTGGYDSVEILKLLDGIIDIYMPDIKYSDSKLALKYSSAPNYWEVCTAAVREMHRQVGDLMIEKGIAQRGLLIRHLILPENIAGTEKVMEFIAATSKNTYVNIMKQYYPTFKASRYPEINRRSTREELEKAKEIARSKGLWRFDKR